jgi:hypothetical protein
MEFRKMTPMVRVHALVRAGLVGLLPVLFGATPAAAQAQAAKPVLPRLGIAPGEPQNRSAQPALPFGVAPGKSSGFVLDFHGYLLLPLTLGANERAAPDAEQGDLVLHNPPQIPNNSRSFRHTGVVPEPYGQLNFTYGNATIAGTLILAARNFTDASGLYNPVEQIGVRDAYVTLDLSGYAGIPLEARVGAYTSRYGVMGTYDLGRYNTPLIARVNTVGQTVTAGFSLGEGITLVLEEGFGGQLGKPNEDTVPQAWNDYAFPDVGATFVGHVHAGLDVFRFAQIGLHYLRAFTRDDTASGAFKADGSISVLGADARLMAGNFGHLYVGMAKTTATNSVTVSGAIEVLNARGGPELMEHYLVGEGAPPAPAFDGDGGLFTLGAQYDLSVARLMYGDAFKGLSPDIIISLFGISTSVDSELPTADGISKLKLGTEVTYNALSWLGVGARFDHVSPNSDESREAFNIISPRVLFHNGWDSQLEVSLQYSHFIYGSNVRIESGSPPLLSDTAVPDADVFTLAGWFWW